MASNKLSQRQIVASISAVTNGNMTPPAIQDYFAQLSGGEITASVEKVYDGGVLFPETLCAPAEIGDITLTRHYDSVRDGVPLKELREMVGRAYYTVSVFELNCGLKDPSTERVYPKALLVGISEPEGDSSSGAPAVYALTFSISNVTSPAAA